MTTDVDINNDKQRRPEYQNSPHEKKNCKSPDSEEDVQQLVEDCMCHQCDKYCLRLAKTNTNGPRTCRVHFGTETKYGKQDTQGLPRTTRSNIFIDRKGILHFRMIRTKSVRVVQPPPPPPHCRKAAAAATALPQRCHRRAARRRQNAAVMLPRCHHRRRAAAQLS